MERFACAAARRPRTQRTECQASERRNETVVYLVPPLLAFSASRSLSPSPDKSETAVVEIAKSPQRVHQIEPVMRQYCSIFYLSLSRYYLCPSLFSNRFKPPRRQNCNRGNAATAQLDSRYVSATMSFLHLSARLDFHRF